MHISHIEFKDAETIYPFCRVALLAAALTSSKHQDGVQKLITKSDCERLKSVSNREKAKNAEKLLSKGWQAVQKCTLTDDDKNVAFGKFAVRMILHILGKSDREDPFESVADISDKFAADCVSLTKAKPSAAGSAVGSMEVTDVLQSSMSELALLQNPHIKVGQKHLTFKTAFCFTT